MAELALAALYRAVQRRLTADPGEIWGGRVNADIAPSGTQRPHVVYAYAAGGEVNRRVGQDAESVLVVKCIADKQEQAFRGAARLLELLNDADASSASPLDGGTAWTIIHCTAEQAVYVREKLDGNDVYHVGNRFRFYMEAN